MPISSRRNRSRCTPEGEGARGCNPPTLGLKLGYVYEKKDFDVFRSTAATTDDTLLSPRNLSKHVSY